MKTIQKISALLVASASFSMAGVINVYTDDAKKASTSLNLTTIDSLTFSGKTANKEMNFSGKAKQNAIKLSDMDHIDFKLKDKSKETMTVVVEEGVLAGSHTFKLSEIKNIEIVEMDSEEDMDSDGLTDLDEIYKYDTNPKSADTDGDGWSDSEELADGMYSPTNPTKFNPRIADVPALRVTLKKSPRINLNVTTSEQTTESVTITEGSEVTKTNSMSYEQTRSTDFMNEWSLSTSQGWELGGSVADGFEGKYTGSVTVGYNGSYTTSSGMTWGSTEEKSVSASYEKAMSNEKSKGSEVNGATLCMQVELKNTSDIAFTIEALKLSASTYDIKDSSTLKILAELTREGDWSDVTLKPNESVDANFCNDNVKVELIEDLIYNTSSIVLGSSSQKVTFDGGASDFTVAYTKVAAKTADITIDYGPGSAGNTSARYQVATNYRYNLDHKGTDDLYAQTTLAELLRNAHVAFKQDSIEGPSKKKLYGLASIDGYDFNLADSAMWYVTIQRAANIKKGLNTMDLYTFAHSSFDMEKIFVGAGDAVHIFYSKDQDHDGVPLPTEHLFGTDDTKKDTDGDGLADYDEITGWTKGESTVKIYTSPTNDDTDGDGMNDKEDPEPTKRPMFTDASLSKLQVFDSDPSDDGVSVLLSKDSAALAKNSSYDVKVQAPVAFIKVVPSAKKVAWVKFKAGKDVKYVQPKEEGGKNVYSFSTPGQLSVLNMTKVEIEVKSEDEVTVKKYTLSISSSLIPPTNLSLAKDTSRSKILVNYDKSMDSRVKGYVILRVKKGTDLPDNIPNKEKITHEGTYNGFESFVDNEGKDSYSDAVGGGSPYYSYRVYAYSMEGNDMVFSKGTDQHTRSVGRIEVTASMTDFGGEFYKVTGGCRADLTANVYLREGSSKTATELTSWYAFDYDAGKRLSGETVFFLSDLFDDGKDKKPDTSKRSKNIGKDGLYLDFQVKASCANGTDFAEQGISWPYAKMAEVLKGSTSVATGRDGAAPTLGAVKYLMGKGGIEYDDTDNECSKDCGEEPRTGYIFNFNYKWVDDNDTY